MEYHDISLQSHSGAWELYIHSEYFSEENNIHYGELLFSVLYNNGGSSSSTQVELEMHSQLHKVDMWMHGSERASFVSVSRDELDQVSDFSRFVEEIAKVHCEKLYLELTEWLDGVGSKSWIEALGKSQLHEWKEFWTDLLTPSRERLSTRNFDESLLSRIDCALKQSTSL